MRGEPREVSPTGVPMPGESLLGTTCCSKDSTSTRVLRRGSAYTPRSRAGISGGQGSPDVRHQPAPGHRCDRYRRLLQGLAFGASSVPVSEGWHRHTSSDQVTATGGTRTAAGACFGRDRLIFFVAAHTVPRFGLSMVQGWSPWCRAARTVPGACWLLTPPHPTPRR